MKKSFTLIEVLVAVSLIVVVIGGFIKINKDLVDMLSLIDKKEKVYSILSLAINDKEDKKIFLDDLIDFKDDEIRRDFKDVRVIQKVRIEDKKDYNIAIIDVLKIELKYKKKVFSFYGFNIE